MENLKEGMPVEASKESKNNIFGDGIKKFLKRKLRMEIKIVLC